MLDFRNFIRYSEQLYEDALSKANIYDNNHYIIGCILISWMAIESLANDIMQNFAYLPEHFSIHEIGFLEEKKVKFINKGKNLGTFSLSKENEFRRLEEKILFLIVKLGKTKKIDKGSNLWQMFIKFEGIRNALTHPKRKKQINLTNKDAEESIYMAKSMISFIYSEIYRKKIKW